jgi:hypothetical protein
MIAYYGPYSAKLGSTPFLGVDIVIVPSDPAKAPLPSPLPQGPQPVEPAAPVPAPAAAAAPGLATITIGGQPVTVASMVIATAIAVGAFALVSASISSYAKKR